MESRNEKCLEQSQQCIVFEAMDYMRSSRMHIINKQIIFKRVKHQEKKPKPWTPLTFGGLGGEGATKESETQPVRYERKSG